MTNDEKNIVINALTSTLERLIDEEPQLIITGTISNVDALIQTSGYLHYFKIDSTAMFTVFYPDSISASIGELLSSGTIFTVKATPVPNDFGSSVFWIYDTSDILAIDGVVVGWEAVPRETA